MFRCQGPDTQTESNSVDMKNIFIQINAKSKNGRKIIKTRERKKKDGRNKASWHDNEIFKSRISSLANIKWQFVRLSHKELLF